MALRHTVFTCNFLLLLLSVSVFPEKMLAQQKEGAAEREYLVGALRKIADPVLFSLAKNHLHKDMPVEQAPGAGGREEVTHFEAFGRLLSGMAPWLELGADASAEGKIRAKYITLARTAIDHATDPASPDFMNFNKGGQPLVDAAFFAQALLRAESQLWKPLPDKVKAQVIAALKSSRKIKPGESNWLLFSAMVEAAILKFTGECETERIDYALKRHEEWYVGDGTYGDGPHFHWDYYNSFVIQPMLIDVLNTLEKSGKGRPDLQKTIVKRAQRYAAVQERLISPEGTYPPLGRSLAYRFGAFQLLSQAALLHFLPEPVKPAQVRAALYTMIRKQIEAPGTFDKNGWLQIGVYGHQPGVAEVYISTGSLYLCSEAFLMLGLPPDNPFWNGPDEPWTQKKIWRGQDVPADHAED